MAVEMIYSPPYWVHALLWGPLILLTTLAPLRPIKGLMIALQFRHKSVLRRLAMVVGAKEGFEMAAELPMGVVCIAGQWLP